VLSISQTAVAGSDTGDSSAAEASAEAVPSTLSLEPLSSTITQAEALPPECVGRYRIERIVGEGAFGTVYLAHDPQLDRHVALKVPNANALNTPGLVERFLREARAAARLRHAHIVTVYDAGSEEGLYYIASAFIAGSTLAHMLTDGPIPPRRAAEWTADLADALQHAHELGIVHRDVKPSNVLIDARGNVVLTDFGLAQHRGLGDSVITAHGTVMGTPGYLAPEVAMGIRGDVPPASDQYSLGTIFFELLSGRRPFEGPSHEVIYRKIEESPPGLIALGAPVSLALEAICLKTLARNPKERFPSCGALVEALRHWLAADAAAPAASSANTTAARLTDAPASAEAALWSRSKPPLSSQPPTRSPTPDGPGALSEPRPARRRSWKLPEPVRAILISLSIYLLIIAAVVALIRFFLDGL